MSHQGDERRREQRGMLLSLVGLLALAGCSAYPQVRDSTTAVLWVRTAAEYTMALRQTFLLAQIRLDEALARSPEGPALIADLDETLLDNSAFEARTIALDQPFDLEEWYRWLSGTGATAMEGSVEFLRHARSRGVAIFLVTNRHERYREATLETLRLRGLLPEEDQGENLLMREQRPSWTRDKSSRREEVARNHQVILLLGNDLNDFVSCAGLNPGERKALVQRNLHRLGREWILIPSPTWGSWLEALHDHRKGLSDGEMRALHLRWLGHTMGEQGAGPNQWSSEQ